MSYPSLCQLFLDALARHHKPDTLLYRGETQWIPISADEMLNRVAACADRLRSLGIHPGDRVAFLSANRPEWHIVDLAILGLGAVHVPLYYKESPERIRYMLEHSGSRVALVAGEAELQNLLRAADGLESVEAIVAVDRNLPQTNRLLGEAALHAIANPSEVSDFCERASAVSPDSLATIIYTSGTTGVPKGVMLSHSNVSSNALCSMNGFPFGEHDIGLSFLPLCHIYGRIVDYCYFHRGVSIAYAEKFELVPQYLLEVRPTVAAAVPRFFEKFYARVMDAVRTAPWHARKRFRWSMEIARRSLPYRVATKPLPPWLQAAWDIADLLVFSRLRKGLGGRMRFFISGGAPLAASLIEFFFSVGIEIYQGYGLTEASPVISNNFPGQNRIGTVGKIIPGVEVKIAEDGEILSRGPNTMLGYYRDPEATRATMHDDWLRTGDLGYLDPDGYLVITDRKKDLIKTAGGKYVAPQLIENKLKTNPYIQDAVILGDRRKFVAALIVPDFRSLEEFARQNSLDSSDRAALLRHPAVHRLYEEQIEALSQDLSQHEKIKQFRLLDQELTYESGELTYTMKIRRRVVEQRFAALIDQMYAEAEALYPSA